MAGGNPLLKGLTGAGFAKMLCKILSRYDLEVKILITQHLWLFSRLLRVLLGPW
jgi:hypothetical protein